MSPLGLGGLVLISRIPSLPTVFLPSSRYVFHFKGIELCPTIEEFGTIMGESEIDNLIFPTMGGDLPYLL